MVRRTSIRDSLRELPAEAEVVDADEPVAVPAQAGAPATPDERTAAPGARAGRRPATGKGTKPAGPGRQTDAAPSTSAVASEPVRVLGADTRSAKRVGLYLHPDDFKALALARVEDSADANARVRAMIALWRGNPRYQKAVDRLARTAPSTGGPDSSTPAGGGAGSEPVRVLAPPSGGSAKRVGLYLHPDDFKALALARVEDSADANARVRAMIALWRGNPRYQKAVDRLARTAPRGGRP